MSKLTELLIQNNFLTTLPIELTQTDLANPKNVFRADGKCSFVSCLKTRELFKDLLFSLVYVQIS